MLNFTNVKKNSLKLIAGIASVSLSMSVAAADSSDSIKLAMNEWTGQHITTHIAGEVLTRSGFDVEYVTAGFLPQFIALQDGTITATLEIWQSSVGDTAEKALATGNVEDMGSVGLKPIEGWYYPNYVAELCPGLPDWKALKDCASIFTTADTYPKGRMLDYPADWETKNNVRVEALGLDLEVISAGSEGALISELKAATLKKQPFMMMFWSPHWIHAEYPGQFVKFPQYEEGCFDDPKWGMNPDKTRDCGFADGWINKFSWVGMEDKWPTAYKILKAFQIDNATQEKMMKAVDIDGQNVEVVAKNWVDNNESTWKEWVNAAGVTDIAKVN